MGLPMRFHALLEAEFLPAKIAFEISFFLMNDRDVPFEICLLGEFHRTILATKRFFASVSLYVSVEMLRLVESFVAILAFEFFEFPKMVF